MQGKLIVFEGSDGSGKATQVKRLGERFCQEKIAFREIDFPRYGNPFAEPARLYLEGVLGEEPEAVNPYAASVLYAIDRYASYYQDWGAFYEAGGLILANRYTTSNAVYQASKLPEEQRNEFLHWLFEMEYKRLKLPEPDLVIYLDLPTELSHKMLLERARTSGSQLDIHERDKKYLEICQENARRIAHDLNWSVLHCDNAKGHVRRMEEIHEEIWQRVNSCLDFASFKD